MLMGVDAGCDKHETDIDGIMLVRLLERHQVLYRKALADIIPGSMQQPWLVRIRGTHEPSEATRCSRCWKPCCPDGYATAIAVRFP